MVVDKIKKLIMIADDDESLRELVRRVLEKNGYSVLEAVSVDDAWKKIQLQQPDLILLDILMYGSSSSGEFVDRLRSSKKYASIKIIYVTAVEGMEKLPKRKNVYGVVAKPFKNKELISQIKKVLEQEEK
jgi:two-component system alkaline phosphatase synthesis response regulator PhoP